MITRCKFAPAMLGLILLPLVLADFSPTLSSGRWLFATPILLGMLCVASLACLTVHTPGLRSFWSFAILAALLFIISRSLWIDYASVEQMSDFRTYHNIALDFTHGLSLENTSFNKLLRPWGYSLVLAGIYKFFDENAQYGVIANVAFGVASLILLQAVGRAAFGEKAGRVAAALFILWPTQLIFTSLLATEHLGMPLALAAVLCVLLNKPESRIPAWRAIMAGVLIAAAYVCRPPLGVLAPVVLLAAAFDRGSIKRRIGMPLLVATSFGVSCCVYNAALMHAFGATPIGGGAFNMLMGSNIEADGAWNQADSVAYREHDSVAEADAYAWREVLRRVRERPLDYPGLIVRKVNLMWGYEGFAVGWILENGELFSYDAVRRIRSLCEAYNFGILLTALIGAAALLSRGNARSSAIIAGVVLTGIVLHAVTESQDRYHYVFSPFLMILSASVCLLFSKQASEAPNSGVGD